MKGHRTPEIYAVKPEELETRSGRVVNLLRPEPDQIDLNDIAYGLSRIFRYGAQSELTVAEHSVHVALYMITMLGCTDPHVIMAGLLHDAAEAYAGDQTRPFLRCLSKDALSEIRMLHCLLDIAIIEKLTGYFPSETDKKLIKQADDIILQLEVVKIGRSCRIIEDTMSLEDKKSMIEDYEYRAKKWLATGHQFEFVMNLRPHMAYSLFHDMFARFRDNLPTRT